MDLNIFGKVRNIKLSVHILSNENIWLSINQQTNIGFNSDKNLCDAKHLFGSVSIQVVCLSKCTESLRSSQWLLCDSENPSHILKATWIVPAFPSIKWLLQDAHKKSSIFLHKLSPTIPLTDFSKHQRHTSRNFSNLLIDINNLYLQETFQENLKSFIPYLF